MQVGEAETISQRGEGIGHLIAVGGGESPDAFLEARMEVDSHSLPVKGLVRRAARPVESLRVERAALMSALTAW